MSTLENNTAELQEILNAVNELPSGGGSGGSSAAIVDVVELPTENIDENVFYRIPTAEFYYNKTPQTTRYCYVVETLPETGEPATDATMSEIRVYYALDTGAVSGYLTAGLAQAFGGSAGWYPAATLFQLAGVAYGGIVSSLQDMTAESTMYLLLQDQVKYYNEGVWHNVQGIGWHGSGIASEVFNSLSNEASGSCSHAEGFLTTASGDNSHAEGYFTRASAQDSHAEGYISRTEGFASHAEGYDSYAGGQAAHAEGHSYAIGKCSHSEGSGAIAIGKHSHAEGGNDGWNSAYITGAANSTTYTIETNEGFERVKLGGIVERAININTNEETYIVATIVGIDPDNETITLDRTLSEIELVNEPVSFICNCLAYGDCSHAEGKYTIAASNEQHVQGRANIIDSDGRYAHIVGNGQSDARRSNAHTLDWDGNAWFAGTIEGTGIILTSPNGTRYKITVSDNGTLSASAVS